jgi:hypothetical protein
MTTLFAAVHESVVGPEAAVDGCLLFLRCQGLSRHL